MGFKISNEIFNKFLFSGGAPAPDGNDVAEEDEVADGVSKNVISS